MSTDMLPLSGIKVLDMSRLFAGPLATQMFGDFGADVYKIERPGRGDEFRHYGPPFLKDDKGNMSPDAPEGCGYLAVNRNKKSVTIDFSKPEGAELVREMARTCDVFVENYKVGTMARYGLDYESIRAVNPSIIYLSVSGFGQTGPYAKRPGTDIAFQAMSGLMSVTGEPDGAPTRSGVVLSDMLTGFYATIALLVALRRRDVQGEGAQYIDVALLDSSISAMSTHALDYFLTGKTPKRTGVRIKGSVPAGIFDCSDGQLTVQASGEDDFRTLCRLLDLPGLPEDPRFATRIDRVHHVDELLPILEARFATGTVIEWYELLVEAGLICAPVYTFDQALNDPQVRHLKVTTKVPHPLVGELEILTNPIRLSGVDFKYSAPPPLGQDTDAVLGEAFGIAGDRLTALKAANIL